MTFLRKVAITVAITFLGKVAVAVAITKKNVANRTLLVLHYFSILVHYAVQHNLNRISYKNKEHEF